MTHVCNNCQRFWGKENTNEGTCILDGQRMKREDTCGYHSATGKIPPQRPIAFGLSPKSVSLGQRND
jgi:hypothetical protein